jgi:hypothetical protein
MPVEFGEDSAGIGVVEGPSDGGFSAVTVAGPGAGLALDGFEAGQAAIQALLGQHADLDLG